MKKIKKMLLSDDTALLNVVRELNAYNGSFSELNYHNDDGDFYIVEKYNVRCKLYEIVELCQKKINNIIIAMLENYNHIDLCNSELEDYIEDNNLIRGVD